MNSMVKEVKERNGASAPVAPSLPSSQTGGGPTGYNGPSHVNEPPKLREAGSSSVPNLPLAGASGSGVLKVTPSDGDSERDFQAANDAQVAQMTSSQREREIEELESTISPELLALLRARVAKKVANADNAVASTSSIKVEPESELEGLAQGIRESIPDEDFSSTEQTSGGDENTMKDQFVATKSGAFGTFALPRDP
jgi:hypothetical protein